MIKNKQILLIVLSIAVLVIVFQINGVLGQAGKTAAEVEQIKKGQYLVEIGGCNDCHTPKKFTEMGPMPDQNLLLSGHPQNLALPKIDPSLIGPGKWVLMNDNLTAAVGPWGVSFAANLTPDVQTGIGLWKEEHFIQALKTGKHMGAGRPILPPMPWFNLSQAKEEDLKAIFAYLKSLKPIRNAVPAPIPPTEFNK